MLIESEYLKKQLRQMMAHVDELDKDEPEVLHHAYEMIRSTLRCVMSTVRALEQAEAALDAGKGGSKDG